MTTRRPAKKWLARGTNLALSLSWHFFLLAILALSVHPLPLPREGPPITVELVPPPPEPELPVLRKLAEEEPAPHAIPPQAVLPKQIEVKPPPPVLRRLTEVPQPPQPLPPQPEPLAVVRPPQPVLSQPTEVQRRPSPAPPKLLDTSRSPPPLPTQAEPAQSVAAPPAPAPAPLQVLTNDRAIQAPVEIKPPARTSIAPRDATVAIPQMPAGGGGSVGAPGAAGGGGGAKPFDGHIVGFENDGLRGGLRMRLGCENPETYRLTPEEKAECLRRLAEQAKVAAAMGPNIPEAKQAEYDRQRACHAATTSAAIPNSTSQSETTGKILGLGANARLRDCGPGDR